MRSVSKSRETKETSISISLNLDGTGKSNIETGIGFFDHMLTLFAFHSGFDLDVKANGDLYVDDHHTIEDIGILLGNCLREALGDRKGINRYGNFMMPMDETLCNVTLDISGRPYLVYHCELTREKIGDYSCEMTEEFLRALAVQAGLTLHVNVLYGTNNHHMVEAIFKALGRALKEAVKITGTEIPSSKGVLEG
ncbi:MAG: imidazoleglycerol-phosphate dehydratase HisB [Faecalicoccus sp.]|nr:imidazoleglycerol-phosphate dehydratase HisB [Faecalicoccus sp.]